jgi:alpha-tubulin suppressor-like RCC1 family protein
MGSVCANLVSLTLGVLMYICGGVGASAASSAATVGSAAVAWGENYHGQLGTIYKDPHEELPVGVEGLNSIATVIATESFNVALLTNGTVASWGGDSNGQLGDGAYKANWEREKSHVMVSGLSGVNAVAAANQHAMALLENGTVQAWGSNAYGQMGQGRGGFESETGINSRVPSPVPGLQEEVTAVTSGGPANYVLLKGGEVEAWGGNPSGQLGVPWPQNCEKRLQPGCERLECRTGGGMELCSASPQPVVDVADRPITGVSAVYAGQEAAYALLNTGEVLSWGSNRRGALGQANIATGQGTVFQPPGKVVRAGGQPLTDVVELAAGYSHALARLADGELVGWGNNELGGLGKLAGDQCVVRVACDPVATPITLPAGVQCEAIAAGNQYSLVLAQHKVYAFGRNEHGELGNGTTANTRSPIPVKLAGPVRAISAGYSHAVALLEAGTQPPPPAVTIQSNTGAVKLGWSAQTAQRLLYRVFERPGAQEFEPEPGEGGGPVGAGEGLAPENVVLPRIRHEPVSPGERTIVGETLRANPGTWRGAEPITFTYEWQRCKISACQPIPGASSPAYIPTAQDVNFFLRLVVTAKNAIAPQGVTAASELTTMVKNRAEMSPLESINLTFDTQQFVLITNLFGQPLTPAPYEFKLTTDKPRTVIGKPA